MAKTVQEQKEEEGIVAKSRPTAMNLSPASSSSAKGSIASKGLGKLIASRRPESRVRRTSELDALSSSQGGLQDAYLGGLMDEVAVQPVATDESQVLWEFYESESWSNHGNEVMEKLLAHKKATGRLVASSTSGNSGIKLNAETGHIISTCLKQSCITWKQSIRS